mmetsp:Transcript_7211/g.28955  ORF Transcript_7211/g.28955 Transcript_7211/m.28955 type:complete len:201 (-) Transcript_7211:21-623(-)
MRRASASARVPSAASARSRAASSCDSMAAWPSSAAAGSAVALEASSSARLAAANSARSLSASDRSWPSCIIVSSSCRATSLCCFLKPSACRRALDTRSATTSRARALTASSWRSSAATRSLSGFSSSVAAAAAAPWAASGTRLSSPSGAASLASTRPRSRAISAFCFLMYASNCCLVSAWPRCGCGVAGGSAASAMPRRL